MMDKNVFLQMATLFCSMLDMVLNGFMFFVEVVKENIHGKENTKVRNMILATTALTYTVTCLFLFFGILLRKSCAFVPWLFLQPMVLLIYFVCLLLRKWDQMTAQNLEIWCYIEIIHDVLIYFYMIGIWSLVYNYFRKLNCDNYEKNTRRLTVNKTLVWTKRKPEKM